MIHIGIIGTAGRGEDIKLLDTTIYENMCEYSFRFIKNYKKEEVILISGGAAWSDHIAVNLYLKNVCNSLILFLPCEFKNGKYEEGSDYKCPGNIANYYHKKFSDKIKISSLNQISEAINKGAAVNVNFNGFFARNLDIANKSDILLAFTNTEGNTPKKDSGTYHTWKNCKSLLKIHISISKLTDLLKFE
ncbi:hypothetical protein M0R36_11060 [bacterium]|jgi:hypothetical protein|nr:hypothetical protein [bacterium]